MSDIQYKPDYDTSSVGALTWREFFRQHDEGFIQISHGYGIQYSIDIEDLYHMFAERLKNDLESIND